MTPEQQAAHDRSRQTITDYMATHPEARDEVMKATFAYHISHAHPKGHFFKGSARDCACIWCERTREQVRWDELPYWCTMRPAEADQSIEEVIRREEIGFDKLFDKARHLVETSDLDHLTGEALSTLHHTQGIDPSMLEVALISAGKPGLPEPLVMDYEIAYRKHRATGLKGLKREVIVAKTKEET